MRRYRHDYEDTRDLTRARVDDIDVPAGWAGTLVALALMILLGGVAAAIVGSFGYNASNQDVTISGVVAGFIVLLLSYMWGGWVAARMARFAPIKNALMTVFWTVALIVLFAVLSAALGADYEVLQRVNLPNWVDFNDITSGIVVSGLLVLAFMALGSIFGGIVGGRYNRVVDESLLEAEDDLATGAVVITDDGFVENDEAVVAEPVVAEPVAEEDVEPVPVVDDGDAVVATPAAPQPVVAEEEPVVLPDEEASVDRTDTDEPVVLPAESTPEVEAERLDDVPAPVAHVEVIDVQAVPVNTDEVDEK